VPDRKREVPRGLTNQKKSFRQSPELPEDCPRQIL